jgi:hypothetical protein
MKSSTGLRLLFSVAGMLLSLSIVPVYGAEGSIPPAGGGLATMARSPFAAPLRYSGAVQNLVLKGVVHTGQFKGAIVQVSESETPSIFSLGSRLLLDLDDHKYEFKVVEIKEKSVVFIGGHLPRIAS